MRKTALLTALAVSLAASSAWAMGGSYSGMGGMNAPSGSFDEYATALRLIHHEKYGDAIPHLQSALMEKPHDADILNYLGFTERMVGNYNYSMAYYQKALTEDPDHKGAHEYLGELYLDLKDLPNAQAQLAILQKLCNGDCDEVAALTRSIAAYQTASAAPVAAPAPTASATPAASSAPVQPAAPATPTQ